MATLSPPVSPLPYGADRPGAERPRAVSSMSHASTSSRRSKGSNKIELTESAKDKRRFGAESKADPTNALREATPAAVALEANTLDDIRAYQHKDQDGNTIVDPDRSNPTRPRMERPLDTIRAFNAAAEGTSVRRSSYSRSQSQGSTYGGDSRRGSYYGNPSNGPMSPQRQRPGMGGYYRNSSYGFSQQGSVMEDPSEGQYYNRPPPMRNPYGGSNGYYNYNNGYNGQNGSYPNDSPMSAHSHQHSYETMTSGSDDYNKSTNPSSLNSSFDQLHLAQQKQQQLHQQQQLQQQQLQQQQQQQYYEQQYGNEMSFAPVSAPKAFNQVSPSQRGPYSQPLQSAPAPPPKEYAPNNPRMPIRLNSDNSGPPPTSMRQLSRITSGESQEKRKSWLKRTFSRKN